MIIMKILFLLLIIICAVFYVMYLWNFALVLLIIMIAVPVAMFIMALITSRLISVELSLSADSAVKNENFPVQLRIKNRSPFPVGKAEAHIEYYNVFNNQINVFELFLPIQAMNTQNITFRLSSKYCGIVKIRCAYISIFDPLRIFRFKSGKNLRSEIAVMPECRDINGEVTFTDRINEESEMFSDNRPGDDPSEVFDLRGYNPGDKLNRIHWKLSSKKDEFIVKEYSLPVDTPAILFLDLKCYEDNNYTLPVFDTLVESLISISQFMLEYERVHTIVYYNSDINHFVERSVTDADSLAETIKEMILSVSDNLYCEAPEAYFFDNKELSLSSFTFITSAKEQSIMEYIDENVDSDIKNAVVVIHSPADSSELLSNYSDLNVIPVVIGRISASIKDIEL